MSALMGTFVRIQTMADGTPRIILDMACSLSEIAAMGLTPGVPFALARITNEASIQQPVEEKPKGGELARDAAVMCQDRRFWKFLETKGYQRIGSEEEARSVICAWCEINSRAELDSNKAAADRFESEFRQPYRAYVNGR